MTKEVVLGTASISKNFQTYIISEARPHLDLKKGDHVAFVLRSGKVYIRKAKKGDL